jgi:hypothetical protein
MSRIHFHPLPSTTPRALSHLAGGGSSSSIPRLCLATPPPPPPTPLEPTILSSWTWTNSLRRPRRRRFISLHSDHILPLTWRNSLRRPRRRSVSLHTDHVLSLTWRSSLRRPLRRRTPPPRSTWRRLSWQPPRPNPRSPGPSPWRP